MTLAEQLAAIDRRLAMLERCSSTSAKLDRIYALLLDVSARLDAALGSQDDQARIENATQDLAAATATLSGAVGSAMPDQRPK